MAVTSRANTDEVDRVHRILRGQPDAFPILLSLAGNMPVNELRYLQRDVVRNLARADSGETALSYSDEAMSVALEHERQLRANIKSYDDLDEYIPDSEELGSEPECSITLEEPGKFVIYQKQFYNYANLEDYYIKNNGLDPLDRKIDWNQVFRVVFPPSEKTDTSPHQKSIKVVV